MAEAAYDRRNILNVTVPKDPGVRILLLINWHEIGKGKTEAKGFTYSEKSWNPIVGKLSQNI